MRDLPYMISSLKKEELESFMRTEYAETLESELDNLLYERKITSIQKELLIAIKADEYYGYCVKGNAWGSVKYYLENFPELLKIHDMLFIDEPVEKFIYIIYSILELEFEKILAYQNLTYEKHQRSLKNSRGISIYIGYITNPRQYTLDDHPVRKAFRIAEKAGVRIGYHYYQSKEEMNGHYCIANIRNFPIVEDDFGDFSKADGGFREDLEAGFKSSWEANIARLLNFKKLDWEYEKASESYSTEIGYYIPDFKVIDKEGKTYIIEVKGYWDDRSVKKVWSAITQSKDEKIIIIDSDYYSILNNEYSNTIPNWETTKTPNASFVLPVIGLTVGNRMATVQTLIEGVQMKLLREPNNPYDKNAIKVLTKDNREVGYISKEWASIFAYKIDCGFTYEVYLKKMQIDKKRIYINLYTEPTYTSELLKKIGFL